ncbi:hypothetical protein N425_01955 [Tannerella sp. oral taxon BU063 isolate Cell 2]|uniref:Uncharacterized protein n=1 Tax=Tannerella sp. oral taxon BU063 isolate Cell 2 TaxID=1411148 RepID=W2C6V5_9BACT|nr:hypothetical protein N425_01955 [Tannerella sp. oral taxon BU063 isolate Cell 2]
MELPFGIFRSIENAVYKGLTGRNELVFVLHKALTRRSGLVFVLHKGLTRSSGLVFVLHKGFEMAKKGREVARGAFGEAEWAEIVGISNSVLHLPRIYTQEV